MYLSRKHVLGMSDQHRNAMAQPNSALRGIVQSQNRMQSAMRLYNIRFSTAEIEHEQKETKKVFRSSEDHQPAGFNGSACEAFRGRSFCVEGSYFECFVIKFINFLPLPTLPRNLTASSASVIPSGKRLATTSASVTHERGVTGGGANVGVGGTSDGRCSNESSVDGRGLASSLALNNEAFSRGLPKLCCSGRRS